MTLHAKVTCDGLEGQHPLVDPFYVHEGKSTIIPGETSVRHAGYIGLTARK